MSSFSLEWKPCFPQGETAAVAYIQERMQRGMLSQCTGNIKQEDWGLYYLL